MQVGTGRLYLAGATTFNFPAGLFQWNNGGIVLNGYTLTNTGTIVLSNPSGTTVNLWGGGTLANQGTIDLTGTGVWDVASKLDNQAGAFFNLQADATIRSDGGGTLSNEGTIAVTAATGTAVLGDGTNSTDGGLNLVNSGPINIASGTLTIGPAGGTSTGTPFTVAAGANLNITYGTFIGSTFTVAASDNVAISGGRSPGEPSSASHKEPPWIWEA